MYLYSIRKNLLSSANSELNKFKITLMTNTKSILIYVGIKAFSAFSLVPTADRGVQGSAKEGSIIWLVHSLAHSLVRSAINCETFLGPFPASDVWAGGP